LIHQQEKAGCFDTRPFLLVRDVLSLAFPMCSDQMSR
jgi:hypothetical protein